MICVFVCVLWSASFLEFWSGSPTFPGIDPNGVLEEACDNPLYTPFKLNWVTPLNPKTPNPLRLPLSLHRNWVVAQKRG